MTTKRRDPKPRPEHVKRARDFIAKNFDGDVDFLESRSRSNSRSSPASGATK